ncbi:MAG: PfkB family carbohydrate kinase [Acidobacteriota bacterium]|nr:PfkB family carbohydrate kinase [Acidobacteriota bacterium]
MRRAGRLGGNANTVGRVSRDVFAEQQRLSPAPAGVNTEYVVTTDDEATGAALIFVEGGGQNMIVIASGEFLRGFSPGLPMEVFHRDGNCDRICRKSWPDGLRVSLPARPSPPETEWFDSARLIAGRIKT